MNPRVVITTAVALIVAGTASFLVAHRKAVETANTSNANYVANRTANATVGLVPRTLPQKPTHATIPPGYDPHTISVKFMDDLDIGIGADGFPLGRSDDAFNSFQNVSLMDDIKKAGGTWLPASTTLDAEKKIDELRTEAEKSGRAIADLNNYFTLVMAEKEDTTKWIDLLNALPEVEIATAAVIAQSAP